MCAGQFIAAFAQWFSEPFLDSVATTPFTNHVEESVICKDEVGRSILTSAQWPVITATLARLQRKEDDVVRFRFTAIKFQLISCSFTTLWRRCSVTTAFAGLTPSASRSNYIAFHVVIPSTPHTDCHRAYSAERRGCCHAH